MSRYLRGLREVPNDVLERCLEHLGEDELAGILSAGERLKSMGFIREDGSLNYSLVLEVVRYAFRDEYLRQVILQAIVREFPSDLKKLLGIGLAGVRLEWSDDFEYFLKHRKRRRKIAMQTVKELWIKNMYVCIPTQRDEYRPDFIAIPTDPDFSRWKYGEAISIEIESPNEILKHPEQIVRNARKWKELGLSRCIIYVREDDVERVYGILREAGVHGVEVRGVT